MKSKQPCLLCGSPAVVLGVFIPEDPVLFGGRKGKVRMVRYGLCAKCAREAGVQERVEKVILSEVREIRP